MNNKIQKTLENLKINGYQVVENFINENEVKLLEKYFDDFLSDQKDDFPFHVNTKFLKSKNLFLNRKDNDYIKKFSSIVDNSYIHEVAKLYLKKNFEPSKLMIYKTEGQQDKDFIENSKYAFVPHTDETYFLKFFIYLTDVDITHGPLNVVPKSHSIFKKKRHDWILKNKNYLKRDKVDYSFENKMIPLVGKKGTMIIFDTDMLHKAGIVEKNKLRKVIRFDFYSFDENYNTLFKRMFLKFKNFLK